MADIRALQDDYLFHAELQFGASDYAAQLAWLKERYNEAAENRESAEVTSQSFEGTTHSMQFRGSTPEERRQALKLAIRQLNIVSGNTRTAPASGLKLDFSTRITST